MVVAVVAATVEVDTAEVAVVAEEVRISCL